MKIKISIGDNNNVIVLDAEHAGIAAQLLTHAKVYKKKGWHSEDGYERSEDELRISYTDDKTIEPLDPKILEANERARESNSQRWKAESKANDLQKQIDDLNARLAGIQSVTTCTVADAEAAPATDEDSEELPI